MVSTRLKQPAAAPQAGADVPSANEATGAATANSNTGPVRLTKNQKRRLKRKQVGGKAEQISGQDRDKRNGDEVGVSAYWIVGRGRLLMR